MLEPLYRGENALEPERVTEKLLQNSFWMGHGGTLTHAISGIDIALWDILGKATGQPVGRLLGGCYRNRVQPYRSLLMDEPEAMHREMFAIPRSGVPGVQDRLGAVRPPRRCRPRRGHRGCRPRRRRRGKRPDGRCRRQRRLLAEQAQMGDGHRADAGPPRRHLVRGAARTRRARRLCPAAPGKPRRDRRRRSADAPPELPTLARCAAPSTSFSRT